MPHIGVCSNSSSTMPITSPVVLSHQCSYLCLDIVSSKGIFSLYDVLCPRKEICSTVISATYSCAEGCIASTCLFVSKARIWTYRNVSSVEYISRIRVLFSEQSFNLSLSFVTLPNLLSEPAVLSTQQISYTGLLYCYTQDKPAC